MDLAILDTLRGQPLMHTGIISPEWETRLGVGSIHVFGKDFTVLPDAPDADFNGRLPVILRKDIPARGYLRLFAVKQIANLHVGRDAL